MSVRAKTPPTEAQCTLTVTGPRASAAAALLALRTLGFVETEPPTAALPAGPAPDMEAVASHIAASLQGFREAVEVSPRSHLSVAPDPHVSDRIPSHVRALVDAVVQQVLVAERGEPAWGASHAGDFLDDGITTGAEAAEAVPWREAFPSRSDAERPGRMLRAARTREDLSQDQLAHLTGIPQRHLSEMEHGKRTIGKERAKKLAAALQVHFSVFL